MSLLAGIQQTFSYLTPRKQQPANRLLSPPDSDYAPNRDRSGAKDYLEEFKNNGELEGDTLLELAKSSEKRGFVEVQASPRKRLRSNDDADILKDDLDSEYEGVTLVTSTSPPGIAQGKFAKSKASADRARMPPPTSNTLDDRKYIPSKSKTKKRAGRAISKGKYDEDSDEEEMFSSKNAIKKNGPKEVVSFDHQKAARYAEALRLPDNGEAWTKAEEDLFTRLAFRGFEPLIPGNWLNDFQTLPPSLFAVEGGYPPLIQPHRQGEFRAIFALRNLFSMGTKLRDRVLSRHQTRPEPLIERTINHYISWALTDVGLHNSQRPKAIPVHAVATLKDGKTTEDAVSSITEKLYQLAERYHDVYSIRDSIEVSQARSTDSPFLQEDSSTSDNSNLPVLIGFVICSSIVVVVTLNSATCISRKKLNQALSQDSAAPHESGVHFIATFDFSDGGMDVWNALAVAICVMRLRKTMLDLCENGEAAGQAEKGGLWEKVDARKVRTEKRGSILGDPDA